MAVKKKMNASVEKFIEQGASVKLVDEKAFKNVLIRIPYGLLLELDEWNTRKPWINRTQWIVEAIHEKLKRDLNEEKENFGGRD